MRYLLLLLVISVVFADDSGTCEKDSQDKDCQYSDFITCGNACCKVVAHVVDDPESAYSDLVTELKNGGPDNMYKFVKGTNFTQHGGYVKYSLQATHQTFAGHYVDTMNFVLYEIDGETLMSGFSISGIEGALFDYGQNYKNIVFLLKNVFTDIKMNRELGCTN